MHQQVLDVGHGALAAIHEPPGPELADNHQLGMLQGRCDGREDLSEYASDIKGRNDRAE